MPPAQHVPISDRRGAAVAGALASAVLLVVGYGSGIGVVPARLGDLAEGTDGDGTGSGAGPGSGEVAALPPPEGDGGPVSLVRSSRPGGASVSTGRAGGTSASVQPARTVVVGVVPSPPATAPPGTAAPTPPPTSRPPTSAPPTIPPPPECRDLVSALLQGLVGHLAQPNPDPVVVQRVSDVLGLQRHLDASSGSLLGGLGGTVTPLLDSVVSTLDATLQPAAGAPPSTELTPDLVRDLRTLLGVAVGGAVPVTAEALTRLLDALLGGC